MGYQQQNLQSKIKLILITSILSSILLLTNIVNFNQTIYSKLDGVFNPFLSKTRSASIQFRIFLEELNNKSSVLKENIDLKRDLIGLEQLKAENKDLLEQIKKLESQLKIKKKQNISLRLVNIVGVQNVFSSHPEITIRLGAKDGVKINDVVFYESDTLLGFVTSVSDRTSKVLPFYSPDLSFKIPVQNVRDTTQKGFISPIENGVVKVVNVPNSVEVYEGDVWTTSNDVAEVPPNLLIGKVKRVTKNKDLSFQELELTIPFNFSDTSYVFIEQRS